MANSASIKTIVPAQQERSRKVERKLISTITRMLNTGTPYEELSVGDIARKAGISVGGFYARFGSKESLLMAALVSTPLNNLGRSLQDFLDDALLQQRSVREIIKGCLTIFTESYDEHKYLFREAALYLRESTHPDISEVVDSLNKNFRKHFHDIIRNHQSNVGHSNPAAAVDMCIVFTMAALREMILFPERTAHLEQFDRERMVNELTDACCAYLQVQ